MYLSDSRYEDYNHNATENIQGHSQTEHVHIYTRERRSVTKNKFSDVKAQKVNCHGIQRPEMQFNQS